MMQPQLIVHADWSRDPKKRWMAKAKQEGESYLLFPPELVGNLQNFFQRLEREVNLGTILVGFDFPIGLPKAYAQKAGINDFLPMLNQFGRGIWKDFYEVADSKEQIGVHRPFYPHVPGGKRRQHLLDGLGLEADALWRRCELKSELRPAASPLFWTLGAKQVGKAAIAGWKDLLAPSIQSADSPIAVWPFSGNLDELMGRYQVVVAETYPTEAYGCFDFPKSGWSKKSQSCRRDRAQEIRKSMARHTQIKFAEPALFALNDGFGESKEGEDPFDAFVGLCFMLEVVLGFRPDGAPSARSVRQIEGWILGCLRSSSLSDAS